MGIKAVKFRSSTATVFAGSAILCGISSIITLFDPDAEIAVFMAVFWAVSLTFILGVLFNGCQISKNEGLLLAVGWIIRLAYPTLNNTGIISFHGDPFFEMGWSVYYGYDSCYHIDWPLQTRYPYFLKAEFHVFGPNVFVAAYVNAFLTMLAVFFTIKCFQLLKINGTIRLLMIGIFSLSPVTILFGAEVYREAVYLFCVAVSFWFFVRWTVSGRHLLNIIMAEFVLIPAVLLHSGYVVIAIAYLMVAFLWFGKITFNRLVYKLLLFIVGGISIVVFARYVFIIISQGGSLSLGKIDFQSIDAFSDRFNYVGSLLQGNGSVYLRWMQAPTSIALMIVYTFIRMFYFLFSPIIWDGLRMQDVLIVVTDSVVFFAGFASAVYVWAKRRNKGCIIRYEISSEYKVLIICAVITVLLVALPFSWGTYAAGTAMRHRNCLLPIVCVLIGICWRTIKICQKRNLSALREIGNT